MATKHEDGSVTLTAVEFKTLANHLEMSADRLYDFLTRHEDGGTREQLVREIMQRISLAHFHPAGPAN